MRVLALVDYLNNVGGAELSARTVLTGLAECEETEVAVVGVDLRGEERLDYPGVDVHAVEVPAIAERAPDFLGDLILERRLGRAVRRHASDADVVHAHHRRSALALRHLETQRPVVTTVRDFWPTCPISIYYVDGEQCTGCDHRLDDCVAFQGWDGIAEAGIKSYLRTKRRHNRRGYHAADCVVFIADHLRRTLTDAEGAPERTEVISNPVSVERPPTPRETPDRPTFVTASTLSREKGVDTAIRAVGRVANEVPGARLHVFGDGERRAEFESLASRTCRAGTVEFHGRRPPSEVLEAMSGATATIVPSRWAEPFGRVTVESMMLGTPVVGTDVGGTAEIIEDGTTGMLFPSGDVEALVERLSRLIGTPGLRNRLAEAGIERASEFEPAAVVRSHRELYASLVESADSY